MKLIVKVMLACFYMLSEHVFWGAFLSLKDNAQTQKENEGIAFWLIVIYISQAIGGKKGQFIFKKGVYIYLCVCVVWY